MRERDIVRADSLTLLHSSLSIVIHMLTFNISTVYAEDAAAIAEVVTAARRTNALKARGFVTAAVTGLDLTECGQEGVNMRYENASDGWGGTSVIFLQGPSQPQIRTQRRADSRLLKEIWMSRQGGHTRLHGYGGYTSAAGTNENDNDDDEM